MFSVFVWSLIATTMATRNDDTMAYMKLNFHCSAPGEFRTDAADTSDSPVASGCLLYLVQADLDNATNTKTDLTGKYGKGAVYAQFLLQLPFADGNGTTLNDGFQTQGSCLNYALNGNVNAFVGSGVAMTKSMRCIYDGNTVNDKAECFTYALPNCSGDATSTTAGFIWGDRSVQGKYAYPGILADNFAQASDWGININGGLQKVPEVTAHRWHTKKQFSGQLVGPYSNNICSGLDIRAAGNWFLPFVMSLEGADGQTDHTDFGEPAVSTTKKCRSARGDKNGHTANDAIWYSWKTGGATSGDITFELSSGAGAKIVGLANATPALGTNAKLTMAECVNGNTHHVITYNMGWDGAFSNCVQAKDADGQAISGKFYKLVPSLNSLGVWPTTVPAPSSSPTSTASPASGLNVSALMASIIAVIAMMM